MKQNDHKLISARHQIMSGDPLVRCLIQRNTVPLRMIGLALGVSILGVRT